MSNLKATQSNRTPMAKTLVKARKIGGSLMVTIPKGVVEQEDVREGDLVEIEVRKAKKSFFGATPGIGSMTREDEFDAHD
jgi:antitoxin component of MazEF toxin-antitoxin module